MPKILIVDDELNSRLLLEEILEEYTDRGVELLTADNGRKALDIIREHNPDIIFLDVMLPGINGYDVCKTIKKELALKNTYVVMITAMGQEFQREKGFDAGADMDISKPFHPDSILECVERFFEIDL